VVGDSQSIAPGRTRLRLATFAVATLALAACTLGGDGAGRERIVVAGVRQPATALYFLAREAGCLEAERLDVEEHVFELGRDALALMREDRADVAIAYETPTLRGAFADPRVRVLTTLHSSTRNTRLVARGDRGIDGFADLAGARIGLAAGSNADFFVELALRFGGIARTRVVVVDLAPEASVAALARGELDAAVLSDPWAARAEQVLGGSARVLQTDVYTEVSLLVTRDDVLAAREGALRRLVRALSCAERFSRERPEDSLRLVGARFPELGEAALRAQLERVRWGLGLDQVVVGVLHDEGEWLRGTGTVEGEPPEARLLVHRRVREAVDPEAVMLLPARRGAP
jgi:NitT/TauT family transport system substrate-binding protein